MADTKCPGTKWGEYQIGFPARLWVMSRRLETSKKMEQRSIVLYLARKGLSPVAIHGDLVTTLGADADEMQMR
jgi:hypothetical protein